MNRYCFAWLILFVGTLSLSKAQVPFYGVYKSPDHSVVLNVYQTNEQTCYKVYRKKRLVVDESPLGIETSDGSFYTGLKLRSNIKSRTGRENYSLTVGKKSPIKVKYSEITIPLINYQSKEMNLIFRVSNDGVAYRYKLLGKGDCTVFREYSGFKLPSNAKGYLTPLSRPKSGWARTNPSYEEHYVYDVPVGTPSSIGCGWTFPALFEVPGTGWVMLSETGVDGGYCASHLAEDSHGGLYQLEMPGTEDGLYSQSPYPTMSMPASTPWRMMIIGDNPCRIAESTMPTDLVKPLYKAKFDVVPGKASWSWLVLKDDSVTYDVSRKFIDMANQLDFKYCLIDAPWDVQIGREGIEKLAAYAKTRNVGLLLWYNSNGNWNDAPQTPKNIMNKPDSRRDEMKWMQRIGIKGIKVDFFGGDKQFFMRYYQDILTDANDYGLTVNFHGTTLPRGWERLFPNFVTCEAVKGMEYITFEQANADLEPSHCATLPFTRNVVGPMDFTPVILNARLGPNRVSGPERRTTAAFELALPVIFFSGIQHFGLIPDNISQFPFCVTDYLRAVPTTWDETHFLSGTPGLDCVVARRSGGKWFVAGINGENKEKSFKLDLRKLIKPGSEGFAITDNAASRNQIEKVDIVVPGKKRKLEMQVAPYGGFVMMLSEKKH